MNMGENLELEQQRGLDVYWQAAKRQRWWFVVPAVVGWLIGVVAIFILPPKFRSETTILVEQPSVPAEYIPPTVSVDLQTRLESLTEQILSRTRLQRIIQDLHLYPEVAAGSESTIGKMRKDIQVDLLQSGTRNQLSGFKISYSASDPHVAQQVAGRLTSLFIAENLKNQQQLSQGTTDFLESELESARKDLERQEAQLRMFRTRYLGELPDQMQGNMQILNGLQTRLDGANQALSHAEQQKLYLSSLLDQARIRPHDTGAAPSIDDRLEKLESQLAEARLRYTPKHPDVLRLEQQVADAEQLKRPIDKASANVKQDEEDATASRTTAQLAGQLRSTDLEIANRRKQIKDIEAEIVQYQARLNMGPAIEQQFASLTRNYNQSRANYESLLSKKLQSQMAANLEKRQQGQQFRVLDPPILPRRPYFPQPLYFALGGLVAGLAIGVGLVFVMEFLNPHVYSEQDIVQLGQPLFGTVPPMPTQEEVVRTRRWHVLEFASAALLAVIIPAITLLTYFRT